MVAAHWVQSGASSPIVTSSNTYSGITLTIPAGGVLKKVIVYNCYASCRLTTPNEFGIWNLSVHWLLTYFSTAYPSRPLHETTLDVPFEVYTYYDSAINSTQPHSVFHAGDRELGFQCKTSYGGLGKPSATLSLTGNCGTQSPFVPSGYTIQGLWAASMKALYYL